MSDSFNFSERTEAALNWLRRSIAVTGGQGSSHSYSPVWGWAKAYPETTGYLIPTLLRYAEINQDKSLQILAGQCQDWLCRIQFADGAFPAGMIGTKRPSVFNTAMILFGLENPVKKISAEENKLAVKKTALSATNWLMRQLDSNSVWRQAAYLPGFVPSYYSYAVWSVLKAGIALEHPDVLEKMRRALQYYAGRFQPDGTVADWGFRPGQAAFTHTIAYTLQGFLESALILRENVILEKCRQSADGLLAEINQAGCTAGRYGAGWKGDYAFVCPTGNAQLSIFYFRLWETTGQEKYRQAAAAFLQETLGFQKLGKNRNTHGALPGSAPFRGPYLRFRYPNWGAKFFLDAADNFGKVE